MRHGRPRAVDQLFAQVSFPPFADAEHFGFAARGVLTWGQSKPRRQVSASSKCTCVTDRGQERRRVDCDNTRNARQTPAPAGHFA